jgi:EAL and modified HD-GYP domain-containing signal transduction protein
MQHPLFSHALIGYEPIIDQRRNVLAMRLRIDPRETGSNLATIYRELAALWSDADSSILVESAAPLDEALLAVDPLERVWIEVPVAFAESEAGRALLPRLRQRGFPMVLGGRPLQPLPAEVLAGFRLAIVDVADDRRLATSAGPEPSRADPRRALPYVQAGVRTIETMETCFRLGAQAVIGWPMGDAPGVAHGGKPNPDALTVIELMAMIDRGEDPATMEALIRRDATLAYRLMRYVNSPGFGLSVEVQSFRHAVMMLGYKRLKRWLALLLVTANKDANMRPVMVASFRRGLVLEHLVGAGQDETLRDEVFMLGVFSLLDKLMKQPFAELFETLNVPERVRETLVENRGAYSPYLRVLETVERGPDHRLTGQLDDCVASLEHCNRAVLRALTAPDLVAA